MNRVVARDCHTFFVAPTMPNAAKDCLAMLNHEGSQYMSMQHLQSGNVALEQGSHCRLEGNRGFAAASVVPVAGTAGAGRTLISRLAHRRFRASLARFGCSKAGKSLPAVTVILTRRAAAHFISSGF
ncbi:hypothetical protein WS67_17180 [Burkholderia singularis]|uniref:Uncharacterized protein n=1 Tax=Burkholderia singularis TaxID=1503053 RepID=A0A103E0E7_9BURK|nr:hypothetical protein WS67_17180 [Burkholderia singularis]